MVEPTTYDAYIERFADGSVRASLSELLGCAARVGAADAALDAVAGRIPTYYDWLRRHDDYTPEVHGPFLARMVASQDVPAGHRGGFFPADAEPLSAEDLDWSLAILDWSYEDLARAPITPQNAIATDALAQEQFWLVSRIEPQPNVASVRQLPGGPAEHLSQTWKASVARLKAVSEEDRERVLEHEGERWSLRKVLRLSILGVRAALDARV